VGGLETDITVFLVTCYVLVGTQNWFLHSNVVQNSVKYAIHLKNGTNFDNATYSKHGCAKNWSDSSIAMEPRGIAECITLIWDTGKAWMRVFISNGDSRVAMLHSAMISKQRFFG